MVVREDSLHKLVTVTILLFSATLLSISVVTLVKASLILESFGESLLTASPSSIMEFPTIVFGFCVGFTTAACAAFFYRSRSTKTIALTLLLTITSLLFFSLKVMEYSTATEHYIGIAVSALATLVVAYSLVVRRT